MTATARRSTLRSCARSDVIALRRRSEPRSAPPVRTTRRAARARPFIARPIIPAVIAKRNAAAIAIAPPKRSASEERRSQGRLPSALQRADCQALSHERRLSSASRPARTPRTSDCDPPGAARCRDDCAAKRGAGSPYKGTRARPIYFDIVREKPNFDRDYFESSKIVRNSHRSLDAVRNPAKISPVNEAALSEMFALPVADATALLSIIGLVLIGDIVARCGPLT